MKFYQSIQLKFFNLNLFFAKLNKKINTSVIDKKKKEGTTHQNFCKLFHRFNFLFFKNKFFWEKNSILFNKNLILKWKFFKIKNNFLKKKDLFLTLNGNIFELDAKKKISEKNEMKNRFYKVNFSSLFTIVNYSNFKPKEIRISFFFLKTFSKIRKKKKVEN